MGGSKIRHLFCKAFSNFNLKCQAYKYTRKLSHKIFSDLSPLLSWSIRLPDTLGTQDLRHTHIYTSQTKVDLFVSTKETVNFILCLSCFSSSRNNFFAKLKQRRES